MTHDPSLHPDRRGSATLFHLVDLACCFPDVAYAARFLAGHGVPFAVTHRVLLHPNQRRRLPC